MNARLLATLVAAGAVAATAMPADAAPKTVKQSWAVVAPVPFPMTTDVPTMYGCIDGEEGVSRVSRNVTLPDAGMLKAELAYTGDWDLYVVDKTGKILAAAETSETGNTSAATEKLAWKKGKKGQVVTIIACNWMGLKDATVTYTYTYGK